MIPHARMSERSNISLFPNHRDGVGFYLMASPPAAAYLYEVGKVLQSPHWNPGDKGGCVWRQLKKFPVGLFV